MIVKDSGIVFSKKMNNDRLIILYESVDEIEGRFQVSANHLESLRHIEQTRQIAGFVESQNSRPGRPRFIHVYKSEPFYALFENTAGSAAQQMMKLLQDEKGDNCDRT